MSFLVAAVAAIVIGEVAGLAGFGPARALLDAVLVLALLLQAGRSRGSDVGRLLPVLALLPLTRLLGLVLAGLRWPSALSAVVVGVPVLLAAAVAARQLRLTRETLGLELREPGLQVVITFSGALLGVAGFALVRPPVAYDTASPWAGLISAAALVCFSGVLEEFVFRGLLQSQAVAALGAPLGLGLTVGLYTTLYFGTLSPLYALFMGGVGLYFSYCVHKTHSVWGVTLAHSLMKILLLLLLPAAMAGG